MISNFKLLPNVNISQNFVQNVQKQKNTFVLSCACVNKDRCPQQGAGLPHKAC